MQTQMLPMSREEMHARGWHECDIILITGDAYVDHHSFGAAVIGRVLESQGFRVGIISQPDWKSADDFTKLGKPKLFFGITSGNVDSMVANYTAQKHRRKTDDYTPGGVGNKRPDHALIVYANRVRESFGDVGIVLGGIEASMRRLGHYDYWSNAVRRSVLVDSRADILVYGMGEKPITEIAHRLSNGEHILELDDIRGTVVVRKTIDQINKSKLTTLPSFETIKENKDTFNEAFKLFSHEQDPLTAKIMVQQHGDRYVIHFPPQPPMTSDELDAVYELPYARAWHPSYASVPGFETVRWSIVSHRGCPGECSFCGLTMHQGRIVQSRSEASIIREVEKLTAQPDFKGTITDIGGPTANLYHASCPQWKKGTSCQNKQCLMPTVCSNLDPGYDAALNLLKHVRTMPRVKHVFISSGLRYDLLVQPKASAYFTELCTHHISGQLKVAPEHACSHVLKLMNKPEYNVYTKFSEMFYARNEMLGKKQFLVHYFICGHPGTTLKDGLNLAVLLAQKGIHPEQIQDFIPLPMTRSGAMYYTMKDPLTGMPVHIPDEKQRRYERALVQYWDPKYKSTVLKVLMQLRALHFAKLFRVSVAFGSGQKGSPVPHGSHPHFSRDNKKGKRFDRKK